MNRIVELRIDNDYTQVELAKKLDMLRGTYSLYEIDQSTLSIELVSKLANLYKVTTDYIVCLTDKDKIGNLKDIKIDKVINTRIKDLRISNNLRQSDIAKILFIKQNTYSQYEIGTRTIPLELLISLCKYYKVSLDYMLYRTDVPNPYPKSKKYVV